MALWQEKQNSSSSSFIDNYLQESKNLEEKLLPYDILGNIAHVKMLQQTNYISKKEEKEILKNLGKLYRKDFIDLEAKEDVHTFVEEKVTEETKAGKKIHTGRSRNDQVALDTTLYMKENIIEIANQTLELVEALENFAENQNMLIPGYTHQQQAMPSSTALWSTSIAQALIDDLKHLKSVFKVVNQNPLGSAAGYGTNLDINREITTKLLGFEKTQENTLYSVNRGKKEHMLVQNLSNIMLDIQKLAEDIINFSEDQKIFKLSEEFVTGSSIMPQKQNPDVLEIARANAAKVNGANQSIYNTISKLPSGYNRDTQQTKKPLIESTETTLNTLKIITDLVENLEVADEFEIKQEIYAANKANEKVEKGIPFREAYQKVKKEKNYEVSDETKPSPQLQNYKKLEKHWKSEKEKFDKVKEELIMETNIQREKAQ